MRSTKDLKDMISGVRAQTKMNGIAGDVSNLSTADEDGIGGSSDEVQKLKNEISELQKKMS